MSLSSRRAWLLLAACVAAPADAQIPLDYRLPPPRDPGLRLNIRHGCAEPSTDDAIIVCGRQDDDRRYRVASEPVPGARRRLIAGEPQSAMGALNAGGCIGDCRRSVGITIDPIRLMRDPLGALRDALHIRD